jgi:hypothetical protein
MLWLDANCRARDEGNKQVQAGTAMQILIDSEELAQTSSTIFADPGETQCLFAMQW